jgi:hypothetical protein
LTRRQNCARRRQSGVAFIEFALILLVLLPLFLGATGIGLNMLRSLATVQLARDAGHMYARGADFSAPGNQTILADLGSDVGLTTTAGTSNAVVILSTVIYIDKAMCAADGKVDGFGNPLGCTNYLKWAFTKRLVIGNGSMRTSNFGTPTASLVDATTGVISLHNQVTNPGAVATFSVINPYAVVDGSVSGLPSGQVIYIAEAASNGIRIPPFAPNSVMYTYNMF